MSISFLSRDNSLPKDYIDDDFLSFIQNQGLQVFRIEGDGNCMFRSVADIIDNDQEKHARYRRLAVQYMSLHPKKFEGHLVISTDGTLEAYLKKMKDEGTWGGDHELEALSKVLKRQFVIYTDSFEIYSYGDEFVALQDPVRLAYDRSKLHYSSLRLRNEPNNEEEIEESVNIPSGKRNHSDFINSNKEKEKSKGKKDDLKGVKRMKFYGKIDSTGIEFKTIFTCSEEDLIYWCVKTGILRKPIHCKRCRSLTGKIITYKLSGSTSYFDNFVWRCKNKDCKNIVYLRKDNKFLESFPRINLRILLLYVFTHFSYLVPPKTSCDTLGLNFETIRSISHLITQWIVENQKLEEIFQGKLGGKDEIVEIDESCFFRRKYNKGRMLKQVWVFGIVERTRGRLFVEVVEKRDQKTLLPVIKKWISKDSTFVISDEWKSYKKLKDLRFNHHSVNHSKNFTDPINPQIHTQTIENRWGQIKLMIKKMGRISREILPQKLKEITWRMKNREKIQIELLHIIVKNCY